jgi:hypothetical protein
LLVLQALLRQQSHYCQYAAVAIAIALMINAIASPAYCNTAGPAAATTTTVSAKSSVVAATSLLLIVVLICYGSDFQMELF